MTTESDNIALLKDAYAQWVDGRGTDCACWMNVIAEDASLASLAEGSPEMPFTARRNGKAEIMSYLEGLMRDWDMVSHAMDEFIAQGDRVVVIGRVAWRNKATGKVVDTPKVDVWRIRDGKAVDYVEFYDTARSLDAARP
ncbi:nuclear transport factor 2 family protein [Microvirga sp. 2TAF3]|uniref:nuclear transport factor 2 family protein n=1 Tax=Microvirga sp. 2TAF3 TaxID=3233014 RepID=UPI003F995F78